MIRDCQLWIAANYTWSNPASRMVARRFIAATGYPPMEYIHSLRVEEAKQILETEDRSVDEVGRNVGYDDPAYFHRLFKRKVALTPARYRRKFAGTGALALHRAMPLSSVAQRTRPAALA